MDHGPYSLSVQCRVVDANIINQAGPKTSWIKIFAAESKIFKNYVLFAPEYVLETQR